jgi:hypothetical protein
VDALLKKSRERVEAGLACTRWRRRRGGLAAGLRRRGDGDQDPGAAGATAGRVAWREQGRLKGADTEHGMAR